MVPQLRQEVFRGREKSSPQRLFQAKSIQTNDTRRAEETWISLPSPEVCLSQGSCSSPCFAENIPGCLPLCFQTAFSSPCQLCAEVPVQSRPNCPRQISVHSCLVTTSQCSACRVTVRRSQAGSTREPCSPSLGADLPRQACSSSTNIPFGCFHGVCVYPEQNVKEKRV